MIASTRWTFSPTASQRSIASRLEPPVVTTSSTIAIDSPARNGPFDELARAVLLRFLANHHAAERNVLARRPA